MNKLKKWTIRVVMTWLFCIALLVTFQTITGVNAATLISKMEVKKNQNLVSHKLKSIDLFFKQLFKMGLIESAAAKEAVQEPSPTLENAFDWSKYPSRTVTATGYTAGYESTGKNLGHPQYGITFSGVKVKRDLYSTVAADLNVFPIGTILFVPGYGYGVVADKGGAIKGDELDLYFETVEDVYKLWGKKRLNVYIVQKGNGKLNEQQLQALNEDKSMQVFRQQYINSEIR